MARRHKLPGVAFTYNDPVVWIEYVHDMAAAFGRPACTRRFVTAGYLTPDALDYVAPVLDAFKFDLKAPDARGWAWLSKVNDPAPCSGGRRAREASARLPRGGGVQHRPRHERR